MKNLKIILAILVLGSLFYSCGKEEEVLPEEIQVIDISGDWLGKGYECLSQFHDEIIRISHNLETEHVTASKITGDLCVPAGYITFYGDYDGKASSFNVRFFGGGPGAPASETYAGSVVVIDSVSMTVRLFNNLIFTKIE